MKKSYRSQQFSILLDTLHHSHVVPSWKGSMMAFRNFDSKLIKFVNEYTEAVTTVLRMCTNSNIKQRFLYLDAKGIIASEERKTVKEENGSFDSFWKFLKYRKIYGCWSPYKTEYIFVVV